MHGVEIAGAVLIRRIEELPDGVSVAIVTCEDGAHFKRLPMAIHYYDTAYGLTGWNSDQCIAYYRSDALIGERNEAGADHSVVALLRFFDI